MLYLLSEWMRDGGPGFLRLFNYVTFQTLAAVVMSFAIVIAMGSRVIRFLQKLKIGDNPNFDQAEINALMASKRGTPTMGGVLIVAAIAIATLLLADLSNFYVVLALVWLLALGAIGAADDLLKLRTQRLAFEGKVEASRHGLSSREKLIFQLSLGAILTYFTWRYGGEVAATRTLFLPFLKDFARELGPVSFVLIGTLFITWFSNAVNLTDGLDGLAAGCMAIVALVFIVLSLVSGEPKLAETLLFHKQAHVAFGQMAVISGAVLGACLGFLWFNANPAKVFMGDTGSLALGGLMGYIALVVRHEVLLLIVGGVFVAEGLSVLMQVSYFKYTRKRFGTGRRIFKMAPVHHHFQKSGWSETQVVVRFWLIGAMLAAIGLATIRLR